MRTECISDFVSLGGKTYPCPISVAMDLVGGKWKAVILYHLQHGPKRFGELRRALISPTEAVLSNQLRQLERDGLVSREVFGSKPPVKTVYSLTEFGRTFLPALTALTEALADYHVDQAYSDEITVEKEAWLKATERCYHLDHGPLPAQTEVFGALNELMGEEDVVINAAGSMPGDLQALWQARSPLQYHVEYAFSCMGYEVPAAMGVKLARPEAEVVSIVGDGTYQMLPMELATVVQENIKVIYVLLQNYGFCSIGALSESRGSQRFGTKYRRRGEGSHLADEQVIDGVDIAANARSWGLDVLEVHTIAEFKEAYRKAEASDRPTMIHIETDLYGPNPPGSSWWDVPVSGVSELESTQRAYEEYLRDRKPQRHYL